MRTFSNSALIWDGNKLRQKTGRLLAEIERDATMWRVRLPSGFRSDMVNLTRAKDAARTLALADLNYREAAA